MDGAGSLLSALTATGHRPFHRPMASGVSEAAGGAATPDEVRACRRSSGSVRPQGRRVRDRALLTVLYRGCGSAKRWRCSRPPAPPPSRRPGRHRQAGPRPRRGTGRRRRPHPPHPRPARPLQPGRDRPLSATCAAASPPAPASRPTSPAVGAVELRQLALAVRTIRSRWRPAAVSMSTRVSILKSVDLVPGRGRRCGAG